MTSHVPKFKEKWNFFYYIHTLFINHSCACILISTIFFRVIIAFFNRFLARIYFDSNLDVRRFYVFFLTFLHWNKNYLGFRANRKSGLRARFTSRCQYNSARLIKSDVRRSTEQEQFQSLGDCVCDFKALLQFRCSNRVSR